jgi:hypothetical protein
MLLIPNHLISERPPIPVAIIIFLFKRIKINKEKDGGKEIKEIKEINRYVLHNTAIFKIKMDKEKAKKNIYCLVIFFKM